MLTHGGILDDRLCDSFNQPLARATRDQRASRLFPCAPSPEGLLGQDSGVRRGELEMCPLHWGKEAPSSGVFVFIPANMPGETLRFLPSVGPEDSGRWA